MFEKLQEIEFTDEEIIGFKKALRTFKIQTETSRDEQIQALTLEKSNVQKRQDVLFNKYTDLKVDDESYAKMNKALTDKILEIQEKITAIERADTKKFDQIEEIGKLLKSPSTTYLNANPVEKRRFLLSLVENFDLNPNGLGITWKKPFDMVAKRQKPKNGGPYWSLSEPSLKRTRRNSASLI